MSQETTPAPAAQTEEPTEFVIDPPTSELEYIEAGYFALQSVADVDEQLLTKDEQRTVRRIRKQSLRLIEKCIGYLYDELFETPENE